MEEFFLRAFFSRDELNVVHQQHVHGVKTFAEADHAVEPQRVDHFDGELLCAYVAQAHRRVALLDGVPDGVHQVGLAHAHAAVQEQRVVRFGGLFRNGARRGVRKLIGLADHESVEGIAQIQLVVAALKIQFGLPRFGGCCRRRGYRLFLAANVLDFNTGSSEFVEHRFDDIPVSAREHLPENRTGNLDEERLTLGTVQPGRLVKVLMLTRALTWSRNVSQEFAASRPTWVAVVIVEKENPVLFPQMCKTCGKRVPLPPFFRLRDAGPRRTLLFAPVAPCAACRTCRPTYCRSKTARDCLRLVCTEQAKNVRRPWRCCTRRAQIFHRRKSAVNARQPPVFQSIP